MPKAIDIVKRREEEILSSLLFLSEKTKGFTDLELIMIGGYALRDFTPFSRFTRDCDFIASCDGCRGDTELTLRP
ncbi:MAG: hypothetical protein HA494_02660 [Thaumarchaeota archaeon]|nr:hypothetical protein [Nitrososphaerota archaeon]